MSSAKTRPPTLHFAMTGEKFEFRSSAKSGDGVFRFRWTLAAGRKGPPEHIHDTESETFSVVSGSLRIWIDGSLHELAAGQHITVRTGQSHRFLNPGTEAVVVDVSLDGTRQEDALVPLAFYLEGREKIGLGDFARMIVHDTEVAATRPPSRIAAAIFSAMAALIRLFGVKPLPLAGSW